MKELKNKLLRLLVILMGSYVSYGSSFASYKRVTIAFYNVENLFYPEENQGVNDMTKHPFSFDKKPSLKAGIKEGFFIKEEKKVCNNQRYDDSFRPSGIKKWTYARYQNKLENIAKVLVDLGKSSSNHPPIAIGLAEISNRKVLEDLICSSSLKKYPYAIIHENAYDPRGIDCAFIYRKDQLKVLSFTSYPIILYNKHHQRQYTRDILLVEALLGNDLFYFIVNHWPSRRGGKKSIYKREKASYTLKKIVDGLLVNKEAKVIIMGDFNDNPTDSSIKKILRPYSKKKSLQPYHLYNPMEDIYRRGGGSLVYKGRWFCMDQFIINGYLIENKKASFSNRYFLDKVGIFKKAYLLYQEGPFKGSPFRTYHGNTYQGGYSDHLPIYLVLYKN